MASNTTYTTTEIAADETDQKQLQLHTHKVQAKSTCKFGAHDKRLACLGSTNTPGRSVKRSQKDLPETVLSRRGLFTGKGKMVIFTGENIMKMISTERARRKEAVGFGIT